MEEIGLSILTHEESHSAPVGHPETSERLNLIAAELACVRGFAFLESTKAALAPICRVHDEFYVRSLIELGERGGGMADPDTYVTASSIVAVRTVVGTLLRAVDRAFAGSPTASFILGRPPGHHARRSQAMGFCLVNNVAVAAQYALDNRLAERVAIVDFDIHHGNGTQEIFYERSDVLYISTHQYPFYPGTGAINETGRGEGDGYNLNIPLPPGTDDDRFFSVFERKILPLLVRYQPQLILVSAGFDGHRLDPLGGFQLTGSVYGRIAAMLRNQARLYCGGRLIAMLEGGYDPQGNLESITEFVKGLRSE